MIRVLNYVALVGVIVAVACTAIVSPLKLRRAVIIVRTIVTTIAWYIISLRIIKV